MLPVRIQNLTTVHRSLTTAAKPPRPPNRNKAHPSVPDPEGSVPKAQAAASPSEQKAWESKSERSETIAAAYLRPRARLYDSSPHSEPGHRPQITNHSGQAAPSKPTTEGTVTISLRADLLYQ